MVQFDTGSIIFQLFMLLISIIGVLITVIAGIFLTQFRELKNEVKELNGNFVQVITKVSDHESRIGKLESE